jgi:hypothetical protein
MSGSLFRKVLRVFALFRYCGGCTGCSGLQLGLIVLLWLQWLHRLHGSPYRGKTGPPGLQPLHAAVWLQWLQPGCSSTAQALQPPATTFHAALVAAEKTAPPWGNGFCNHCNRRNQSEWADWQ